MMIQYLKKQFELVEMYFVSLFFLITPAIYTTKILDPVLVSRYYALSGFIFVLTILLGVLFYYKRFKFRLGKYDKWVFGFALAYILWNFLSITGAVNVKEAIFQALKETGLMISFFYFYQLLRNNSRGRDFIIKSLVLMTLTFIVIAIVQLLKADFTKFFEAEAYLGYYLAQALKPVFSTFSGKNLFPMFLVLSLSVSIYSVLLHEKFWKVISVFCILGSIFFILLLASRSAWLGLAIFSISAYVFLLVYLFTKSETFKSKSKGIQSLTIAIPGFLILLAVVFVMASNHQLAKAIKDKALLAVSSEYSKNTVKDPNGPSSGKTRQIVWEKSLDMAKDNPILGVGAGQWRIVHPSYGLDQYDNEIRQGRKLFQRAHNDYLWIAGEVGFVGLLFYLALYGLILFIAIRNFKTSSDKKVKVFSVLAFSSLLAFAVIMLFSFPRERIAINMVYLMIFALILNDSPFKSKSEACDMSPIANYGILFGLFLLLGFNLYVARQMYNGEKAARMANYSQMNEKWRLLLKSAYMVENTFYTIDPLCVPMKYYEGVAHAKLEDTDKAFRAFKEAYELCPYGLITLNNLATSYEQLDEQEIALEYYYKALDISPRFADGLMNAAIVNMKLKKPVEALELLKRIELEYDKHPKYDKAILTASKLQASMIQKSFNKEKLITWYNDENKIKLTFVRFKEGNEDFRQILMDELGGN